MDPISSLSSILSSLYKNDSPARKFSSTEKKTINVYNQSPVSKRVDSQNNGLNKHSFVIIPGETSLSAERKEQKISQTFHTITGTSEDLLRSRPGELATSTQSESTFPEDAKLLNRSPQQIDKIIVDDWKATVLPASSETTSVKDLQMKYDEITEFEQTAPLKDQPYEATILELYKPENHHTFISVNDMFRTSVKYDLKVLELIEETNTSEDNQTNLFEGYIHHTNDINTIQAISARNSRKISYHSAMETDMPRGGFTVDGVGMALDENGKVTAEEMKKVMKKLNDVGIHDDDIIIVSSIFNQGLLRPISNYLMSNYNCIAKAVDFSLNIEPAKEVDLGPIIRGEMTMEIKNPGSSEVYYIPVKILVTNLTSTDRNLANIHYYIGPIDKNSPPPIDSQ